MIPDRFPQNFLQEFWQKKPLLIRQAFPGFTAELDADDIAGLACDDLAESRLICGSYPEQDWTLRYGPFSEQDFTGLAENNWTLLVQDVEKHYPPLQSLLNSFSFLPSWRIDDLMVSVAAPGGSVGPHVDQYDVFLLQAAGHRKWQAAASFDPALLPDCELNVLNSFEAEQEWVLDPGDMLYLPPGVAHHGIALDRGESPCMTWSIGMRAPSSADLLQALGEWLAANAEEGERYRDSDLAVEPNAGEIDAGTIGNLRKLVSGAASDEQAFRAFAGSFLSRYRLPHDPARSEQPIDAQALHRALGQGAQLQHNPWTRLLWMKTERGAALYAAGEEFPCSSDLAQAICNKPVKFNNESGLSEEAVGLVWELLNKGHLYLDFPE